MSSRLAVETYKQLAYIRHVHVKDLTGFFDWGFPRAAPKTPLILSLQVFWMRIGRSKYCTVISWSFL